MTTPDTYAKTAGSRGCFRLPDPPQREPDEMTQYDSLFKAGNSHSLAVHLGNPGSTLVEADRWIVPDENFNKARARRPDLLVAFDVDPQAYESSNGYVVSEQGKPPDFVLEVASESTAEVDLNQKRDYYAMIGVREYWRFDKTGRHHGVRLAGERLVNGQYVAIDIEELPGGSLQGYSAALNLHLRWERGDLAFCDPVTGRRIATLEDERARADTAEAELSLEREARVTEQARADAAEARVRELEERLGLKD